MRAATAFRFFAVQLSAVLAGEVGPQEHSQPATAEGDSDVPEFEEYLRRHGRQYSAEEWYARLENFRRSVRAIESHRAKNRTHSLHLNEFADKGEAEFSQMWLGLSARTDARASLRGAAPSLGVHRAGVAAGLLGSRLGPKRVDWRESGKVTAPRQQGGCGACWAFASSSALASAWGIAGGEMTNVSQQQLLDCAREDYHNDGCNGGQFDGTYRYTQGVELCTAESWPYEWAQSDSCAVPRDCRIGIPRGAVQGYKDVEFASEEALLDAVAQQPVNVGIMVDPHAGLMLYQGGIFSGDCTSKPNHAVTVVGYGTDNGQDYWLVQNSWGTNWGEGGYFRLARGKGPDSLGECGILTMPSYPVVQVPLDQTTTETSAPTVNASKMFDEPTTTSNASDPFVI